MFIKTVTSQTCIRLVVRKSEKHTAMCHACATTDSIKQILSVRINDPIQILKNIKVLHNVHSTKLCQVKHTTHL